MQDDIKEALTKDATEWDRTIDITTTGRRSGTPRRVEIWFHNLEDEIYITGTPGSRGWLANMIANPEFTFHLKHNATADIPAKASPIFEEGERRRILGEITARLGYGDDLDNWLSRAPLVRVEFPSS